jgi:hypothetical protein
MSHVTMKVTKKKKVGKSRLRKRVKEARSHAKGRKFRRISKDPKESAKAEALKKRVVEKKQEAKTQEAANAKMAEKPARQPDSVSWCEPEGRGAPPPLPTPIATFNF